MSATPLGRCLIIRSGHGASGDEMLYVAPVTDKVPGPDELDEIGLQMYGDLGMRGFNDSMYECRRFVRNPEFPIVATTVLKGITMTKKDYNRLAADLRLERHKLVANSSSGSRYFALEGFNVAVGCIISALARENGNFDKLTFVNAIMKED